MKVPWSRVQQYWMRVMRASEWWSPHLDGKKEKKKKEEGESKRRREEWKRKG